MQPQITHEAEVHRQHVRLQVPIAVEIDATRFTVDDWSIGGFGIHSEITSRQPGERFPARLIFPFEDFEVSIRLDCQMVYILDDNTRFGCKFLSLSQGQLSLFRYLIDAYLTGELVSGGDILSVAGRDNSAEARVQVHDHNPYTVQESWGQRLKRVLGLFLIFAIGAALIGFIGFGLRERLFIVRSDDAVIYAPTARLRASGAGFIEAFDVELAVQPNQPLGQIVSTTGNATQLTSPCACVLLRWFPAPGGYVAEGEEIAILVSSSATVTVRAELTIDQARRIEVGDQAVFSIPGEDEVMTGSVLAIDFRSPLLGRVDTGPSSRSVIVSVLPDGNLPIGAVGKLASVRFD